MTQPAYEQRIQAIAIEFAREMHPQAWADRSHSVPDSRYWSIKVDNYKPLARMAVAETVEGIKSALVVYGGEGLTREDIDIYLKEQGLIPDNAQEGGQDANV